MKKNYFKYLMIIFLMNGMLTLFTNQKINAQTTYTVNSTADDSDDTIGDGSCDIGDGSCTLRAAIEEADSDVEADIIEFSITGTGPHTITPGSALPSLTNPLTVDGTSEPDYVDSPVVEISGTSAGETRAIDIKSDDCVIKGLVINQFDGAGIVIEDGSNNVIELNYVGTDPTGTMDEGNTESGINVGGATSSGNIIRDNVFSGNDINGIVLWQESSNSTVIGNYVGTSADGTSDLGNTNDGIVLNESSGNQIGGPATEDKNLISGNGNDGIEITGMIFGATIQGNYIGTDVNGTTAIPNAIGISGGTIEDGLTIGGSNTGEGNVISGNSGDGISLFGKAIIQDNYIGTTIDGTTGLGNGGHGIKINDGDGHVIKGNVTSGNSASGIYLMNTTSNSTVQGNYIGTNAEGTVAIPNMEDGIAIEDADNNLIGGTADGEENLISGNANEGIFLVGTACTGNEIKGNLIGTDFSGTTALPNLNGINIELTPTSNLIGGNAEGAQNIISGNTLNGIWISSSGNTAESNSIGLNIAGEALGNGENGVKIDNTATNTVLTNVISGNKQDGIKILGSGSTGNLIRGNYIGTNKSGDAAVGNTLAGVSVISGASNNQIGGTVAGDGNVIAGNGTTGIFMGSLSSGTTVKGNTIDCNQSGTTAIPNGNHGIAIDQSSGNIVGGTDTGSGNLVSGGGGIFVIGGDSKDNLIQGNLIGTDATGLAAIAGTSGTHNGISFESVPNQNTVGGTTAAARNVVSGFSGNGIWLLTSSNITVQGNYVGSDKNGENVIGNGEHGIRVDDGSSNMIGGNTSAEGNLIVGSAAHGVGIVGEGALFNSILSNSIYDSGVLGIDLGSDGTTPNDVGDIDIGPNNFQNSPEIDLEIIYSDGSATMLYSVDSDPQNSFYPLTIQFFVAEEGEGKSFFTSDTYSETDFSNGGKEFDFGKLTDMNFEVDDLIVSTATDADGNTSEFSAVTVVTGLGENLISQLQFNSYPNPFSSHVTVEYELSRQGLVDLSLLNISGQLVKSITVEEQLPGNHSITWQNDLPDQTSIYLLVMKVNGYLIKKERLIKLN